VGTGDLGRHRRHCFPCTHYCPDSNPKVKRRLPRIKAMKGAFYHIVCPLYLLCSCFALCIMATFYVCCATFAQLHTCMLHMLPCVMYATHPLFHALWQCHCVMSKCKTRAGDIGCRHPLHDKFENVPFSASPTLRLCAACANFALLVPTARAHFVPLCCLGAHAACQ